MKNYTSRHVLFDELTTFPFAKFQKNHTIIKSKLSSDVSVTQVIKKNCTPKLPSSSHLTRTNQVNCVDNSSISTQQVDSSDSLDSPNKVKVNSISSLHNHDICLNSSPNILFETAPSTESSQLNDYSHPNQSINQPPNRTNTSAHPIQSISQPPTPHSSHDYQV